MLEFSTNELDDYRAEIAETVENIEGKLASFGAKVEELEETVKKQNQKFEEIYKAINLSNQTMNENNTLIVQNLTSLEDQLNSLFSHLKLSPTYYDRKDNFYPKSNFHS